MTEPADHEPKPPLQLAAALEPGFVGESPVLSATGGLGREGHASITYKSYQQAPEEPFKSVVAGLAQIAETGMTGISVVESVPLVALPGDNAEAIKKRWQALKLLSRADVIVEEIEPRPDKTSEVLRSEIGTELLRILGPKIEQAFRESHRRNNPPKSPELVIDWTKQRTVQDFAISGTDVPAWLKGMDLQISTDGTLIKTAPPRSYNMWATAVEGPAQVVSTNNFNSTNLQPIDQPASSRISMGHEYKDLEERYLPELLRTMQHLKRVRF